MLDLDTCAQSPTTKLRTTLLYGPKIASTNSGLESLELTPRLQNYELTQHLATSIVPYIIEYLVIGRLQLSV